VFNVKVTRSGRPRSRKMKRMGRSEGRRADWKKAVVTLAPGHKIELVEGGRSAWPSDRQADVRRAALPDVPYDRNTRSRSPRKLLRPKRGTKRPERLRAYHRAIAAAGQADGGVVDFRREKYGIPARVPAGSSTTRIARRGWPCSTTGTARSAIYRAATGFEWRTA